MDPDATLRLLQEALEDNNMGDAAQHAAALRKWMQMGGFTPKVTYHQFEAMLTFILIHAEDQA